ncbi:FMN-dependent NADH-azoreductase [Yoonia sediminilitoris]|uniref:FMN dependent NADH:quinone oxidoreductase n=1 Tax=Yoonia sediminilitoris TaxID=1286148 RepID=A0A2T6KEP8_9RHOB|nr:NAD(P)H-dependent oxidoreductase [Yoonia sediminilitoris]PUB13604.1 FMN-dependent NADH-azoreductase [Yoonia sediminilitoris]RCW94774.1 FMN-dependent NADH-azoreductase [Yoonia sediminilitoris]
MRKVLRVDASARRDGSVTRDLADRVIAKLGSSEVITRDLLDGVPFIDETWVGANFTPESDRTLQQIEVLAYSDQLIREVMDSDTLVIGVPIYNFAVPAALKAWVDLVARVGVTFAYTETGPVGLLKNKRAVIIVASGGVASGSEDDYAVNYMRHFLAFLGIVDVEVVAADQLMLDAETSLRGAHEAIENLAASHTSAIS